MQEYDIRKGFQDNIQPDKLRTLMAETFGSVEERNGKLVSKFGAIKEIEAWPSKKTLCVNTTMDPTVSNDVAQQTIKAYNAFLEKATGYTSKERGKRAQKKAKEGKL